MNGLRSASLSARIAEWRARLAEPWLVAAWAGMGMVGHLAIACLAKKLSAHPIGELAPEPAFDSRNIDVANGLILAPRAPRSMLLGWKNPAGGRDLVLFAGDVQPERGALDVTEELVSIAAELGVVRVCTFAAMATLARPEAAPRVFAAASDAQLLDEVCRAGAEPLAEGSIGGLNGTLVAAAARRGARGVCLLGEMPYFASSIANPKATAAVLRTFARLSGVSVDLADLDARAAIVERNLVEHLERAEQTTAALQEAAKNAERERPATAPAAEELARATRARIEELFALAARDRTKASELKAELDRHGLFKEYEDRFLDLWKRAE